MKPPADRAHGDEITNSDDIESVELSATVPVALLAELTPVLWLLSPNGIETTDRMCLGGDALGDGLVRFTAYVAPGEAVHAQHILQSEAAKHGLALQVAATALHRQDWNRVWKQFYHPFVVAGCLRVEPAWEQSADVAGEVRIVIDPGMAFGTGTHETTQLCMAEVLRWCRAPGQTPQKLAALTLLDLGTGSAILATLAVKLGFGHAIGTDIDAAALTTARLNLALNGVADRVQLVLSGDPAGTAPARFPLVLANILATVLLPLRDSIFARVEPLGTLVLSGILAREADQVAHHYAALGLALLRIETNGAWAAVVLQRQG